MLYLLDMHHVPPCVVLATASEQHLNEVAQRYADQVGRPLVVATGPAPDSPHFKPTVPTLAVVPTGAEGMPQNVPE